MERAKEAGKRERGVCKLRERFGLLEQINSDLTYAVAVNLAQAYHAAQLYSEALNSFTQIVRSKQFPQVCYLATMLSLQRCGRDTYSVNVYLAVLLECERKPSSDTLNATLGEDH